MYSLRVFILSAPGPIAAASTLVTSSNLLLAAILKSAQGYKTQTMLTLILGLSSMVGIFILSLIF